MKLQQTSLDQTGVAVFENNAGEQKIIPLFTLNPVGEAQSLQISYFREWEVKHIYVTNNLMQAKIEDIIEEYRKGHKALPEDYMEELLSGFPYIQGLEPAFKKAYYA